MKFLPLLPSRLKINAYNSTEIMFERLHSESRFIFLQARTITLIPTQLEAASGWWGVCAVATLGTDTAHPAAPCTQKTAPSEMKTLILYKTENRTRSCYFKKWIYVATPVINSRQMHNRSAKGRDNFHRYPLWKERAIKGRCQRATISATTEEHKVFAGKLQTL